MIYYEQKSSEEFALKVLVFFLLVVGSLVLRAEDPVVYADLPETAVLARVDGKILTKAEVERRLTLFEKLRQHRLKAISDRDKVVFRQTFRMAAPRLFVSETLLKAYAEKSAVTNDTETLDRFREKAFRAYRAKGDKSFDDLKKIRGVHGAALEAQVASEALSESVTRHLVAAEPLVLSPTYAEDEIRLMLEYNERMVLTNALIYARATNTWERLKQGEDFLKVGKEMTELPEERDDDLDWGTFELSDFNDAPEFKAAVASLKVGAYTPPLSADNGVVIARLNLRDTDDDTVELSRIYFRLPVMMKPAPKEEIVAEAHRKHAVAVFAKAMKAWRARAKVEFPYREIDFKE